MGELFPRLVRGPRGGVLDCGCDARHYTYRVEAWDLIRRCIGCGVEHQITCPDASCGSGFRREATGPHLRAVCWCGWWVGPIPKSPEERSPRVRYVAARLMRIGSGGHCAICGCVAQEVDHVVPLHLGGLDVQANLQPLCPRCHAAKTARERGYGG